MGLGGTGTGYLSRMCRGARRGWRTHLSDAVLEVSQQFSTLPQIPYHGVTMNSI